MSDRDFLGDCTYKTTYQQGYQPLTCLPPILYHQQPAIEYLNDLVPRYKRKEVIDRICKNVVLSYKTRKSKEAAQPKRKVCIDGDFK